MLVRLGSRKFELFEVLPSTELGAGNGSDFARTQLGVGIDGIPNLVHGDQHDTWLCHGENDVVLWVLQNEREHVRDRKFAQQQRGLSVLPRNIEVVVLTVVVRRGGVAVVVVVEKCSEKGLIEHLTECF